MLLKKKINKTIIQIIFYSIITSLLLPIILLITLIYGLYKVFNLLKIKKYYHNKKYNYLDIQKEIKFMDFKTFEIFCAEIFKQLGYKVTLTQVTNDGGKDIILKKNNITTYVECKRWYGKYKVGREYLQKLVGSAIGDNITNMIFITTSNYNKNAVEYANKIPNLKLWTTVDLMKQINKLNLKQINNIMNKINYNKYRKNDLKKLDLIYNQIHKANNYYKRMTR